jgi:hypothetical protein
MKLNIFVICGLLLCTPHALSQAGSYDGLENSLANLYRLSSAKTFSIGPENLTGEKGKGGTAIQGTASDAARDLGQGWKVNPFVVIGPRKTFTLAEINGAGEIQHIWMRQQGTGGSQFCECIGMKRRSLRGSTSW